MLGIRKVNGVAVDLFQGDTSTFSCERPIAIQPRAIAGFAPSGDWFFDELIDSGPHAVFFFAACDENDGPSAAQTAQAVMDQVRRVLVQMAPESPLRKMRRVTFVLPTKEMYQVFQTALFTAFPE